MEKNSRVIALQRTDDGKAYLYGRGVYVGDHVPESGLLHELGVPNPKIELDNGGVVYGYQCWWGDEKLMGGKLERMKIIDVPLPED